MIEVTEADRALWKRMCEAGDDGAYEAEALAMLASHRQQAEDAMRERAGDMLRKAIEDGYPLPSDKTTQCEHGHFGWEDCIACYDNTLRAKVAAIRGINAGGGE